MGLGSMVELVVRGRTGRQRVLRSASKVINLLLISRLLFTTIGDRNASHHQSKISLSLSIITTICGSAKAPQIYLSLGK